MTRFFLPSGAKGRADTERAYTCLREQAESATGSVAHERRIEEIECRRQGLDHRLRVGERDAIDGRTVAAILQLGRHAYTVHHVSSDAGQATLPTVLQRAEVYSAADFD
jgi:hypothetical protein